jgi:hypothetical protein
MQDSDAPIYHPCKRPMVAGGVLHKPGPDREPMRYVLYRCPQCNASAEVPEITGQADEDTVLDLRPAPSYRPLVYRKRRVGA